MADKEYPKTIAEGIEKAYHEDGEIKFSDFSKSDLADFIQELFDKGVLNNYLNLR